MVMEVIKWEGTILSNLLSEAKGIIHFDYIFRALIGENFTLSNFALQDFRAIKQNVISEGHTLVFEAPK